jgi:hypothetical protein
MATKKNGKAKKTTKMEKITRIHMTEKEGLKYFNAHCKAHDLEGEERVHFAMVYTGKRLAALARDNAKHA